MSRMPDSYLVSRRLAVAKWELAAQDADERPPVSKAPVGRFRSLRAVGSPEDTAPDDLREDEEY